MRCFNDRYEHRKKQPPDENTAIRNPDIIKIRQMGDGFILVFFLNLNISGPAVKFVVTAL